MTFTQLDLSIFRRARWEARDSQRTQAAREDAENTAQEAAYALRVAYPTGPIPGAGKVETEMIRTYPLTNDLK